MFDCLNDIALTFHDLIFRFKNFQMSSETLQGKLSRLKSEFSVFFDRLTQQAREEFQGIPKTALNEETEKLWEEFKVIHLNTHQIKNALEVFLQERLLT